jgi:hypothetical protein
VKLSHPLAGQNVGITQVGERAAPFVPLLLTIWSPEDVIMRIVQVVF